MLYNNGAWTIRLNFAYSKRLAKILAGPNTKSVWEENRVNEIYSLYKNKLPENTPIDPFYINYN